LAIVTLDLAPQVGEHQRPRRHDEAAPRRVARRTICKAAANSMSTSRLFAPVAKRTTWIATTPSNVIVST
jgi:hypothetical protein